MDDFLPEFLAEAAENIAILDQDIVNLEQNPGDKDVLQKIFRTMHNLKGTSGMMGLKRLEKTSHAAEDVLGKMRDGTLGITPTTISPILSAIDLIKNILSGLNQTKTEPEGDDTELIARLKSLLSEATSSQSPEPLQGIKPQPDPTQAVATGMVTSAATTQIQAPAAAPSPTQGTDLLSSLTDQSIRVSVDVLDKLMNLVGELVLNRNQLVQMTQADDDSHYISPIQQLNRVTSGLQEVVMKTRMQPIGNAWAKLPRIIRDVARTNEKQVNLVMKGQDTEVDRQVIQIIQDPLVHCIRNSVDHAIEKPDKRLTSGKPAAGVVQLSAFHEGGNIVVEITDDGAGINTERVKQKAIEKNLITAEDAQKMTHDQLVHLIFEPGFSTAEKVTSVSGRGVGMDVVRSNIEKIGGSVEISTRLGKGTTIRMKIPLTLAIIPAMIVGIEVEQGMEAFAIPQGNILELVRIREENRNWVENIHGGKVLRLREDLIPLLDLSQILKIPRKKTQTDDEVIIIAQVNNVPFGLILDETFDTQEIVVKPAGKMIREVGIFSGTTILGDGRVVLILDIPKLALRSLPLLLQENAEKAKNTSKQAELAAAAAASEQGEQSSLLLFKAADSSPLAIPLALVSRLEEFPIKKIEVVDGHYFMQYRNSLLPLIPCRPGVLTPELIKNTTSEEATIKAIIFSQQSRAMGLVVSEILDVTEERLHIESTTKADGSLGVAVLNGRTTEIIDTYHFLQKAYPDWFQTAAKKDSGRKKILLAEDSRFFQDLLLPFLRSVGFDVTLGTNGAEALSFCEEIPNFDLVLSDIEMPIMDGLTLAKKLREKPEWKNVPLLALTSLQSPPDRQRGLEAGFSEYLVKFDRDKLLTAIGYLLKLPTSQFKAEEAKS